MLLSLAMRLILSNDFLFEENFPVPSAKIVGDLLAPELSTR